MSRNFENDNDWLRGNNDDEENADDFDFDWDADETPGKQDDRHTGVTGQLSWLKDDDNQSGQADDDEDEFIPDWLKDAGENKPTKTDSQRTGVTGQLSWLQDDDTTEEQRDDKRLGVTGQLDWRKASFEDQLDAAGLPSVPSGKDDVPDWLRGMDKPAFDDDEEAAPIAEEDDDDVPDWLRGSQPTFDDADDEDILPVAEDDDDDVPDWLRGSQPTFDDADDEDILPVAEEDDDDVPDWLRGSQPTFDDADDEDILPVAEDDDDDVPDWLRGSQPTFGDADDEDILPVAEDDDDDVPDWLRGSQPAFDDVDDEDATPDWMSGSSVFDVNADVTPEVEDEDDVPDWLRPDTAPADDLSSLFQDLPTSQPEPDLETNDDFDLFSQLTADADDADLESLLQPDADFDLLGALSEESAGTGDEEDDFFNQLIAREERPHTAPLVPPQQDEDVDDFFTNLMSQPAEPATPDDAFSEIWEAEEEPVSEAPTLKEDEAADDIGDLDWLRDIESEADKSASQWQRPRVSTTPSVPAVSKPGDFEDLDSLLSSLELEETPQLPTTGDLSPANLDFDALFADPSFATLDEARDNELAPQTPDWLSSINVGEVSASSIVRSQKDRPLEDLSERLLILREEGLELGNVEEEVREFEPAIVAGPPQVAGTLQLTPEHKRYIEELNKVIGVSEEEGAAAKPRRRMQIRLGRLIMSLMVAAAVIAPFFVNAARIGNLPPDTFELNSPQQMIFDRINTLNSGDLVLFSAEYGATAAGELDAATAPLLQHILSRGARPVIVSSNPVGLLHVSNIVDEIAGTTLERNTDYFVGRYLVGDVVGLRAYAQNISALVTTDMQGQPTGLNVGSLDNFALIVVVVERSDSVRTWAEQIAPITRTPLLVASSVSASPLAYPYLNSIDGLMVGYRDAYTYSEQLGQPVINVPPTNTPTEIPPTNIPRPTSTPEVIATDEVDATDEATSEATVESTETDPVEITPTEATPVPTDIAPTETTAVPTQTTAPMLTIIPASSPTPAETETPEVTATSSGGTRTGEIEASQSVNMRSGPGTGFAPVTSLLPGTRVEVIGENEDGSWFNIRLEDGREGWVSSSLVELDEDSSFIPGMYGWGVSIMRQEEPTATPPTPQNVTNPAAAIPYRDERWYGMTLGIIVIVIIIAVSNLFHLARKLSGR